MTGKQLRIKAVSIVGKNIVKGATHFESLIGLGLTGVLLYGMVISLNSIVA